MNLTSVAIFIFILLMVPSMLSGFEGYNYMRSNTASELDDRQRYQNGRIDAMNSIQNRHPTRYILHLDDSTSHGALESHIKESFPLADFQVLHRFSKVLHAVVVEGLAFDQLQSLRGVKRIAKDAKRSALGGPHLNKYYRPSLNAQSTGRNWGVDRIHQSVWNYDNDTYDYIPEFSGAGVDIYIIDTGVDVTHGELAPGPFSRVVKNIYNYYLCSGSSLSCQTTRKIGLNGPTSNENNDGHGHGTHCSGTAGGLNDGVAAGANIFGLKVLDDQGSGFTSTSLEALEYLYDFISARKGLVNGSRSVISMSLGGDCEIPVNFDFTTDGDYLSYCQKSSDVIALEKLLADLDVVAAVAAGNEYANACFGSPSYAPNAVTVGASDIYDEMADFSNFGECVDIISPGVDIRSACSGKSTNLGIGVTCLNDGRFDYTVLSGTSMATPHVAGVMAQLLERYPTASSSQIKTYLTCNALKDQIALESSSRAMIRDTVTPNLLLQVPQTNIDPTSCTEGSGCPSSCSNVGKCLNEHSALRHPTLASPALTCHCGVLNSGPDCSESVNFNSCPSNTERVALYFEIESAAYYWSVISYSITSIAGTLQDIEDYAFDAGGTYRLNTARHYCIPAGCYNINFASGYNPKQATWSINGLSGGLPESSLLPWKLYQYPFCVDSDGVVTSKCKAADSVPALIVLKNTKKTGWSGAHYKFANSTGHVLYTGFLDSMRKSRIHGICVPKNGSYELGFLTQPVDKKQISSISMVFNGIEVTPKMHPIEISVSADGSIVVNMNTYSPTVTPTATPSYSMPPTIKPTSEPHSSFNNNYLYLILLVIPPLIFAVYYVVRRARVEQPVPTEKENSFDAKAVVPI